MHFDGLNGIFRTGRIKTATWSKKERWQAGLIQTNYKNKNFCKNFSEHKLYIFFPHEEFRQFMTCFVISQGRYIFFCHDDNIMSCGKYAFVETKKFSDQPFDSVSFYSVSRFLRYCNAEPFNPLSVYACYGRKMFRTSPHPLIVNYFKPASAVYPFCFPKRLLLHAYRPDHPLMAINMPDLHC